MTTWLLTEAEWRAIGLSVQAALIAVALSLPLGVAMGRLLARRRFPGKTLVETAVNLPLVLPPVVTGLLLLAVFGRNGWIGRWLDAWLGVRFVFDFNGVVLAAAVAAFPLMVRAIRLAFSGIDQRLEQAARTLGAGPIDAFFTVSLPLAWRGVVAGCVLAFARSLGEFGATIMIAGNIPGETQTIPLYIYGLFESPGGLQAAWRIVTVSIVVAAAALAVSEYLERRGHYEAASR
ncbi:MAG: molybdate ABC transporter permease subunit [Planctomycetes bacterium]|nr:molybdate ABC transporter permease subunit [Planctomycetota bacterium]